MRAERDLDAIILRLTGEFDLECEERFQAELQTALSDPAAMLVLDLRGLGFIDSTGLRVLVQIDGLAHSDGFEFVILSGDGHVGRVLRGTGLDRALSVVGRAGAVPTSRSRV